MFHLNLQGCWRYFELPGVLLESPLAPSVPLVLPVSLLEV